LERVLDRFIYVYNTLTKIFKIDTDKRNKFVKVENINKNLQALKYFLKQDRRNIVSSIREFQRSTKLQCGFNGQNNSTEMNVNNVTSYVGEFDKM
jgi:hypothetical protein